MPNGRVSIEPASVYCDVQWQGLSCYTGTYCTAVEGISVPAWSFGAYFCSSPCFSHLFFLLFLPLAAHVAVCWCSWPCSWTAKANWKGKVLSADQVWQHCLARGRCAIPCWECSQKKKQLCCEKQSAPQLPGQLAKGTRWFLAQKEGGIPILYALWLWG